MDDGLNKEWYDEMDDGWKVWYDERKQLDEDWKVCNKENMKTKVYFLWLEEEKSCVVKLLKLCRDSIESVRIDLETEDLENIMQFQDDELELLLAYNKRIHEGHGKFCTDDTTCQCGIIFSRLI